MKSGTMTGENRGSLKLLLCEVHSSVCSIQVVALWFTATQTRKALGAGKRPDAPLELACKTWGPGLEQNLFYEGLAC